MKCHFVYSVPSVGCRSFWGRIEKRIRRELWKRGLSIALFTDRQPTEDDLNAWPVQSPYENTRNIYLSLSRIAPTLLYHLTERVHCNCEPDDVFLGHPYFPYIEKQYGVTEIAFTEKVRPRRRALITPLHCNLSVRTDHINREFLNDIDRMMPQADILFGIMGEYWWDQWDSSPYRHWKSKMVRLDMAVDCQRYPQVKKSFNLPGQRGYMFIGNSSDLRKGTDYMSQIMNALGDCPKGWIGSGPEILGMERIAEHCQLTPGFMAEVGRRYDFFITTAIADPNPTTILESMAWGFPVLCTPQSGYYETSYLKNVYLDDMNKTLNILNDYQFMPVRQLSHIAGEARRIVEEKYTWKIFTNKIVQHLFGE